MSSTSSACSTISARTSSSDDRSRAAPFLACLGLLVIWQVASLALKNDSVPTALEAIRAIPAILGDKDSLVNFGASLRRMAIGFGVAVRALDSARAVDGPQPGRGVVLQSAVDGDLSGAEGGADADHHAVAWRRRPRQDAGDLSRRQPARDLPQLRRRQGGRREDAVVRRGHGAVGRAAPGPHRACRRRCRKSSPAAAPAWCWR